MIFNEVTKRLFDNAVKKLQGNIDNIQTTSRATLSTAGWYRVAEFASDAYGIKGSYGNGCIISLKGWYVNSGNCDCLLKLSSVANSQKFGLISNFAFNNTMPIPKIRYAYDTANLKAYIEIYYNVNVKNHVEIEILSPKSATNTAWVAIDAVATSETVSGVTVATTYDIPANASPVTDLDLANYMPKSGGEINGNVAVNGKVFATVNEGESYFRVQNSNGILDLIVSTDGSRGLFDRTGGSWFARIKSDGTKEFNGTATGNLPLTGGILNGELRFKVVENGYGKVVKNHSASADEGMTLVDYDKDGNFARLLVSAKYNKAQFVDNSGSKKDIHHDGNSAKVAFTESDTEAPSDTTALWAHL